MTAALAIEGGPADTHADLPCNLGCCLHPGHDGVHYAVVRELAAGAVWLRWLGPVCELVVLDDCAQESRDGMDMCPLFAGHKGPHR